MWWSEYRRHDRCRETGTLDTSSSVDGHVVGSRTFTLTMNAVTTNSATTIPCDIDKCALNVQGTGNVDGTKDQTLVFQGPSSFKVYYLWSCFGSQAPGLQATLLGFDNNTALTVRNGDLPGGSKLIVSTQRYGRITARRRPSRISTPGRSRFKARVPGPSKSCRPENVLVLVANCGSKSSVCTL